MAVRMAPGPGSRVQRVQLPRKEVTRGSWWDIAAASGSSAGAEKPDGGIRPQSLFKFLPISLRQVERGNPADPEMDESQHKSSVWLLFEIP